MEWAKLLVRFVRSRDFVLASDLAVATWTRLLAYCAEQENLGVFQVNEKWSAREWLMVAGVTPEGIAAAADAGLVERRDGSIIVVGYVGAPEANAATSRENGARGGRPRKGQHVITGTPKENQSVIPQVNQQVSLEERRGEKSREEKKREESATPAGPPRSPPVAGALALAIQEPEPPPKPEPKAREPSLFDRLSVAFASAWEKRYGCAYSATPKDRQQLGNLLKQKPPREQLDALPGCFARYVEDDDTFLVKQGHSLAWFCTSGGLNKYRSANVNAGRRSSDRGYAPPPPREAHPEIPGEQEL